MAQSSLPLYTPSEPSPKYSCEPACDERTLQCTPRTHRPTPTGTFTKTYGGSTVILFEQENGAKIPSYGRRGDICGSICFDDPHKVIHVSIKVEGKLEATSASGGAKSATLLSFSRILWKRGQEEQISDLIPFSYVLPTTFYFDGKEQALPPSFATSNIKMPTFHIRALYSITVRVTRTRTRHRNFDFLTKEDEIKIPFKYFPRTRAHRPIIPSPGFFSVVKTSPEEWYQALSTMKPRTSFEIEPIHCHLFVPAGRIYGLGDKIPFHVQLNGSLHSLQQLLVPQSQIASTSSSWSTKRSPEKCPLRSKINIKVFLLRQYYVEEANDRAWRNATIGEGEIWEVPPAICEAQGAVHLDWEGELRCQEDICVGGFVAGNVGVKDYIVLSLDPPVDDDHPSPFLALQMSVPIRFVTDSYMEVNDYEPPDA